MPKPSSKGNQRALRDAYAAVKLAYQAHLAELGRHREGDDRERYYALGDLTRRQQYLVIQQMLVTPNIENEVRFLMVDVSITPNQLDTHYKGAEGVKTALENLAGGFQAEPLVQEVTAIQDELKLICTDSGAGGGSIDLGCGCTRDECTRYVQALEEKLGPMLETGVVKITAFLMSMEACRYRPFAWESDFENYVMTYNIAAWAPSEEEIDRQVRRRSRHKKERRGE